MRKLSVNVPEMHCEFTAFPELAARSNQYLERQINDPNMKTALMLRSHAAMNRAIAQGNLATARVDAYMEDKRSAMPPSAPPPPSSP
jgi:hypothetical protein